MFTTSGECPFSWRIWKAEREKREEGEIGFGIM
jgi:hypothetical protein